MISSCCFWRLSLYWALILSISGLRSCMARMLLTCLTVSGKRMLRTTTVSIAMESHQGAPIPSWKYSSTWPMTETTGLKRFWKKSATVLTMRSSSSYRVVPSLRERVAPQQPPGSHESTLQQPVLLDGLERVERAARRKPARGRQHGGDVPPVDSYQGEAKALEHRLPRPGFPGVARFAELAQRSGELLAQLPESSLGRGRPRRHDEVEVAGDVGERGVKDLPEPPPHGVARHRVPHPPGDGEAEARRTQLVGKSMHREELAPVGDALPVDPLKVRGVGQACSLTPRQRSNSEPLPPAPASGSEDPAPPDRTHAPAKAVRFGSFSTVGLIGALHGKLLTGALDIANDRAEYIRSLSGHPAAGDARTADEQTSRTGFLQRRARRKLLESGTFSMRRERPE